MYGNFANGGPFKDTVSGCACRRQSDSGLNKGQECERLAESVQASSDFRPENDEGLIGTVERQ